MNLLIVNHFIGLIDQLHFWLFANINADVAIIFHAPIAQCHQRAMVAPKWQRLLTKSRRTTKFRVRSKVTRKSPYLASANQPSCCCEIVVISQYTWRRLLLHLHSQGGTTNITLQCIRLHHTWITTGTTQFIQCMFFLVSIEFRCVNIIRRSWKRLSRQRLLTALHTLL